MSLFLDQRRYAILKAIIESYIEHATPVGSQRLLEDYDFLVSAATMRNEMAFLEQLGLIESPHTSAGRIPTDQGMRLFVDQLMDDFPVDRLTCMQASKTIESHQNSGDERLIKDAITSLTKTCNLVSFATMPWKGDYSCFGLSNLLKCGDFDDSIATSTIMEMLEDKDGFVKFLTRLSITDDTHVVIGEENAISAFTSCSLIVGKFVLPSGNSGLIGVLGPKRMNYAYNVAAVNTMRSQLLQGY